MSPLYNPSAGEVSDAELAAAVAATTNVHGILDTTQVALRNAANDYSAVQRMSADLLLSGGPWIDPRHPDFGALFNGVADDTVAMQAAIDEAIATGWPIRLPDGIAVISAKLIINNTNGFFMEGTGPRQSAGTNGTQFKWVGNATDPMFEIIDCVKPIFGRFSIGAVAATPLKYGFQIYKSASAVFAPRQATFYDVLQNGTNGGIGKGWYYGGALAIDQDNDMGRFYNCRVSNYAICGWDFGHSQSLSHLLVGCDALGTTGSRVGIACGYDYVGAVDTWVQGGNFEHVGGFMGHNELSDYALGGLTGTVSIYGVHSESSACLWYEPNSASLPMPLTLSGIRWAHAGQLAADGFFIRRSSGPTIMEGCKIEDFAPGNNMRMSLNKSGGRNQLTMKGCNIQTTQTTLAGLVVANTGIDLDVSGLVLYNLANTTFTYVPATYSRQQISTKTGAYTLTDFDQGSPVYADATGGAFTITLPTAVGRDGCEFIVVRTNLGANNVTIATTSAQTIDGATPRVLSSAFDTLRIVSNGANWTTVAQRYFPSVDSGGALHGIGIGASGLTGRALNIDTGTLPATTPNPSAGIYATTTLVVPTSASTAASVRGLYSVVNATIVTSGQAATGVISGVFTDLTIGGGGAGNASDVRAFYAAANHAGSGVVAAMYGLFSRVGPGGTGNITNLYGIYVNPFKGSSGVPVTAYGMRITAMSALGNTNGYGIYIEDVSNAATLNYAIYTNAGTVRLGGMLTLVGNLDHDGSNVGFFGVAPAVRASAYTQTYATATKTVANPTATVLTDNTVGTPNTTLEALADGSVYATDVAAIRNNFADLAAAVNALIVDVAGNKQNLTSVIDDLQSYGLLQ